MGIKKEGSPLKILVVDDDDQIFEVIKGYLEIHVEENPGLEVRTVHAHDGPMALSKLQNEDFHLFIIDNQMPKFEGLKLIDLLKKGNKTRRTPIIFISGIFHGSEVKEALSFGIRHVLAKPFDGVKLLNTIRQAIHPFPF